jgi:hypothetical protein
LLESSVFALHLKLHPGIRYSHSSGKVCFPPIFQDITSSTYKYSINLLKYDLSFAESDWRYPFDLCGSVYRMEDLHSILVLTNSDKSESLPFTNPNNLEVYGNKQFWESSLKLSTRYKQILCSSHPVLSVVTINQVQSTYDVPIYQNEKGELDYLNKVLLQFIEDENGSLLDKSSNYDLPRYRNQSYQSVHVGDLFLLKNLEVEEGLPKKEKEQKEFTNAPFYNSSPRATVVLPVYNGEQFLKECLDSLFLSDQGCSFSFLAINDGSTDKSLTILQGYQQQLVQKSPSQHFQIINLSENQGLSAALDVALKHCQTEYIARIDCDDLFLSHRLQRQMEYLDYHSDIHVVGSQASRCSNVDQKNKNNTTITMYCHPLLVQFAFCFHCPLLHPSVMIRRRILMECGGYSGLLSEDNYKSSESVPQKEKQSESHQCAVKYVEDYFLWSRIRERYSNSLFLIQNV